MTGPEHYREAERLLDRNRGFDADGQRDNDEGRCAMKALAHATLALAAATADLCTGRTDEESQAWAAALTGKTGGPQ